MVRSGRKFMVVIDSTPECINALYFAGLRAQRTGAGILMLYVIEPDDFQHWLGIAEVMYQEKVQEAQNRLAVLIEDIQESCGITPEYIIRRGIPIDEVRAVIKENNQVSILVLGASSGKKGPGPLVTHLAYENADTLPIPITIIPQSMSFEDLRAIC